MIVDVEVSCQEAWEIKFGEGIFEGDRLGSRVQGSGVNVREAKLWGIRAEATKGCVHIEVHDVVGG